MRTSVLTGKDDFDVAHTHSLNHGSLECSDPEKLSRSPVCFIPRFHQRDHMHKLLPRVLARMIDSSIHHQSYNTENRYQSTQQGPRNENTDVATVALKQIQMHSF